MKLVSRCKIIRKNEEIAYNQQGCIEKKIWFLFSQVCLGVSGGWPEFYENAIQ